MSRILKRSNQYIMNFIVVAVAFAMATTLSLAQTKSKEDNSATEKEKPQRTYERMIAHGGGTVEGFDTSSSVDALMQSIEKGFKVIELDMEFSYDNKIIMLHDWDRTVNNYLGRSFDQRLTAAQFNNQLICGKFEPLTFEKLTKIMDKNPEIKIVTDTKGDNIKLLTTIAEKYPKYIDRIIPQIYDYSEFEGVEALGYEDIIFTLYTQETVQYEKLLKFVKENHIYAVTMPENYWVKGLDTKLSKDGVIVYTHPISTVEDAKAQFDRGVYGIYSSTLIPSEIEGYSGEYYLLQEGEKGKSVKLTDATLDEDAVRALKIHGNLEDKALKYKLNGQVFETGLLEMEDSISNPHNFTIEIWESSEDAQEEGNQPLFTMEYSLTKNDGQVRILDKKYAYRLKALKALPDFDTILEGMIPKNKKPSEKIIDILSNSFVAKAGGYYYYNNGESGSYSVGDELMSPQKSISGNVIVPLSDTVMALGAKNVFMDSAKYVYIAMGDAKTVSQVYSNYVRKNTYNNKVSVTISLYRSKAMAGGEVISVASGRNYIEDRDLLIILPAGCQVSENEQEKLIDAAEWLYQE